MKFLFVYYGGAMATTPAAQKKSNDMWMAWFKNQGKAIADIGAAVKPGKMVGKTGAKAMTGEMVTGYTVVMADNLDAAVAIAKTSPNVMEGGTIGVYELMPM
jgi:hypothetical protein